MDTFARPLASLLSFFYDIVPDYSAAIALLTLTVMLVLLPLTLKGTRSMIAMQQIAPDIKRLQDKHKNDRQKLNEEVMALYRDNKINPVSGCLPLLVQIPVFWVLYSAIHGLTHHSGSGAYEPQYLDSGSLLYHDLKEAGGKMVSLGVDLSNTAIGTHASFWAAVPFFAMIAIMVGAQYYQMWQISSRAVAANDTPQAAQMRKIQKVFPPVFGVFSLGFPAALVLYWTISSLFRVAQQWGMYKFDPILKANVKAAHKEAEKFLAEADGTGRAQKSPRAQKAPVRSTPKSNKKKRKGR